MSKPLFVPAVGSVWRSSLRIREKDAPLYYVRALVDETVVVLRHYSQRKKCWLYEVHYLFHKSPDGWHESYIPAKARKAGSPKEGDEETDPT